MNVRRTNRSLSGLGCSDGAADCVGCAIASAGTPANGPIMWTSGGYPSSINQFVNSTPTTPNATTQALVQTTPDTPSPTAQVVAQSFSSQTQDSPQPGNVALPFLNWVANNLSFVNPVPAASSCPITDWMSANPWLLIGGVAVLAMMASGKLKG